MFQDVLTCKLVSEMQVMHWYSY